MNNVVFIHAIGQRQEYEYGKQSWNTWCKKNNVELFILDEPILSLDVMFPNYQRYFMFDLLDNSGIKYDRVLTVDADTLIHPDAPNFFETTSPDKLYMVHDDGSYDWIIRGMEHYEKEIPELNDIWFDFGDYGNSGFQLLGSKHKKFFKSMLEFWNRNSEKIIEVTNTYGVGKEQTLWNFMIRKENIDWCMLPYEYNMTSMPKKEILTNDFLFTKLGWIYHFNGIERKDEGVVADWMRKTHNYLEEL